MRGRTGGNPIAAMERTQSESQPDSGLLGSTQGRNMATGETGRGGGGDGEASSSSLANPQRIPLRKSVSSLGIGSERVKYFDESLKAWYDRLPYQRSPGQNVRAAVNERLRSHQPGNGVLTDLSQEGRVPLKLFSNSIFLDDSNLRAKGGQGRGDGNGTNSEVPIRHPSGTEEDSDVEGLKVKLQKVEKQSLVEIVVKHYAELVALGLVAEAKQLSAALDELTQAATRVSPDRTLTGVDQLLKNGLLDFLLKINPILPQTGSQVVKFKNVTCTAKVTRSLTTFETVGTKLAPCLNPKAPAELFHILKDCTGYLMPGTMTILLGPPGCGKSSLHQALSGLVVSNKQATLSGSVTYNGRSTDQLHVRKIASYIGQTDVHIPFLTVRETLEFASACKFGIQTLSGPVPEELFAWFDKDEIASGGLKLEVTLHLLGLMRAQNTIVGNEFVRGVSGGERRRVTTAEMLAGTNSVLFLDEISTGLDSSATYDIVHALRTMARVRDYTMLLSLLQPAPEVFNMFDRVILLDCGRIVYQGPREDVVPYFSKLGYEKPPRVDVADFLQEVTTDAGLAFLKTGFEALDLDGFVEAYESSDIYHDVLRVVDNQQVVCEIWVEDVQPLGLQLADTISHGAPQIMVERIEPSGTLARCNIAHTKSVRQGDLLTALTGPEGMLEYVATPVHQGGSTATAADVQQRVVKSGGKGVRLQFERRIETKSSPHHDNMNEYVQTPLESVKTVFKRQWKVAIRNRAFITARMLQVIVLGVFTGTVFYQIPEGFMNTDMDLKRSIAFLGMLAMALGAVAQMPTQIDQRAVFYKQYDARFYRPQAYVIAGTLAGIPFSLLEALVYCPLVYWLSGFSRDHRGANFVMFVFLVFLVAMVASAKVRFFSSISPTREAAGSLTGFSIAIFLLFSGFLVTKNKIRDWWIWVYYISPLQWGYTAVTLNEFLSDRYDKPCSSLSPSPAVQYCFQRVNMSFVPLDLKAGEAYLKFFGFPTSYSVVWLSIAMLLAWYLLFTMGSFITHTKLQFKQVPNPPEARLKPLDKQQLMSRWKLMAKRIGSQIQLKDKDQNRGLTNRSIKEKDANGGNGRNRTTDQGHGQAGTDVEQGRTLMISSSGLKFEPVTLSFHGLCYEIDIPGIRHPRILLNHVSGYAKPGTMTALMGSSGAGKTTLLDVLAGRKTIGRINGEILVNGYPVVQQTYARIRGYVEQNDIHTPFATVRESLEFSATLRLPRGTPAKIRRDYVKEVMDLLDLHPIANHLVGIRGDGGLSIEQAKRLTIAVELVANPSILFLDEPTSGLSSRAAQSVITGIQNIVATGRSVICTIHQPSRRLFLAFNQLLLMKTGGEVVYFGPLGHDGRDLLDYFESLPGIPKCRNDQNPASYMLEVVGAGIGHAAPRDFVQDYQRSELAQRNEETLTHLRHGKGKLGYNPTAKGYAASPGLMGLTIFKRMFRTYWRNVSYSVGRIMFHIGLGLLLGTTYVRIHGKMRVDLPTVLSMGGLIYIALVFIAMVNANNVIPQVNYERPVYYREQASNMYSTFLYNVSWGFAEVPYLMLSTLIFCSICFTIANVAVYNVRAFFEFWFVFFAYSATITFLGIFLAMLTPNAQTATIIIPIVSNIWNIMSGFMIPKKSIPNFYIWLFWVNPTQYALNALTSIAFYCDVQKNPNCPKLKETDAYVWPTMKAARSLDYSRRYIDMLALLLFMAAFRALAYVALKFMKYNRR